MSQDPTEFWINWKRSWATYLNHYGYNIFPIDRNSKHPSIRWEEYQTRRSTSEEVAGWLAQWPLMNMGIPTGATSGVVVIDADSPSAVAYCKLHMPTTPFRLKSRKGMHFYYRHPGFEVKNGVRIHPTQPIDVRGDGGYVVTVGSIHETLFVYELDAGASIVPVDTLPVYDPAWFPKHQILSFGDLPVVLEKSSQERAMAWVLRQDGYGEGERNHAIFKQAAWLIRDVECDFEEALDCLQEWNSTKFSPPLQEGEVEQIVRSAYGSRS